MQGPRSPARGAHAHHRSSSSNASPDHGTAGVASPTRNAVVTALLRQVSDAARQRAITEREKAAIKDILLAGELTEARDRLTLATAPLGVVERRRPRRAARSLVASRRLPRASTLREQ